MTPTWADVEVERESVEAAVTRSELTDQQAQFLLDEVDRLSSDDIGLLNIEGTLTDEIERFLSETNLPMLNDMPPPLSVITLAAEAAAKVFMAFERGYRMGD